MSPHHFALWLRMACSLLAIAFLTACGASMEPTPAALSTQLPQTVMREGLPAIGELDALALARDGGRPRSGAGKASSSWLEGFGRLLNMVLGWNPLAASPSAEIEAGVLTLETTEADPFEHAVYAVDVPPGMTLGGMEASLIGNDVAGLIGTDGATLIGTDGATLIGTDGATLITDNGAAMVRRYALANFETNRWEYADSFDNGLIDMEDLPGDPGDYVSPADKAYVAPLLYSPGPSKLRISSITGLPCEPGDTTVPADPANFLVTGIPGGLHFSWGSLGDQYTFLKFYISKSDFSTPDEPGVVCMNYHGSEGEAIFPWQDGYTAYIRVQSHHTRSCLNGTLSTLHVVQALPGELLPLTVEANPAVADAGAPAVVTAQGAALYDWDLNNDGIYEITGDATGVMQINAGGAPGPQYGRVKGTDGAGGIAIRGFSIYRHGWHSVQIDPDTDDQGGMLGMVRLADGRPAVAHFSNWVSSGGEAKILRYCTPADTLGLGPWSVQDLDTAVFSPTNMHFIIANQCPVIVYGVNETSHIRAYSTLSPTGAPGSWVFSNVDENRENVRSANIAALGNTNTADDPGAIYIAYESEYDIDGDSFDYTRDIDVAAATQDGTGKYTLALGDRALEDNNGEDTAGGFIYAGIGQVAGQVIGFGNLTVESLQPLDLLYAYRIPASGEYSAPLGISALHWPAAWQRQIFDAAGHFACVYHKDGTPRLLLGDTVGPAFDNLSETILPACDFLHGGTAKYDGELLFLGVTADKFQVYHAPEAQAGDPAAWTVEATNHRTNIGRGYNIGAVALIDGHIAVVHPGEAGGSPLVYSIRF
jgi:predicted lipoprotein with Yx(FWY)xxD motif